MDKFLLSLWVYLREFFQNGAHLQEKLKRELNLTQSTALNMIDMVGIGPFIVVPLVIQEMNGPQAMLAWVLGAFLSFLDGFVWAELGAAYPNAGGTYSFLKNIYGEKGPGRYFSFLFIWQTIIQAPLVVASGAIGFAQYFTYLAPIDPLMQKAVSGALVLLLVLLLYRRIGEVGNISVLLWIGVVGTMVWIIFGGVTHFDPAKAFDYPEGAFTFDLVFFAALGSATIKTIYTYLGYYNVCHLGSEVKNPEKIIPQSMFISIAGIAVLYLIMQMSFLGVIHWEEIKNSQFVVSLFMERIYGTTAAKIVTLLILWIAFSSLFAVLVGYTRIPYAAALDGNFFKVFGEVHPVKNFPHKSLLILGGIAFVFSLLFRLKDVIAAILAMRILVQFVNQTIGLIYLHKKGVRENFPYKMPLFPLPPLISLLVWIGLFLSTGFNFIAGGLGMIMLGSIVYFFRAYRQKEWPFAQQL